MFRSFHFMTAVAAIALLGACGSNNDSTSTDPCPAITGDKHLAAATVKPGGYDVMLHTGGFACPTVGENTFALYPMSKMKAKVESMAEFEAAMDSTTSTEPGPNALLAIDSVTITMPSMGHGPAKPPVVSKDKLNQFSADFQMPGDWRAEIKFVAAEVTTAVQTVVLDFTVK